MSAKEKKKIYNAVTADGQERCWAQPGCQCVALSPNVLAGAQPAPVAAGPPAPRPGAGISLRPLITCAEQLF